MIFLKRYWFPIILIAGVVFYSLKCASHYETLIDEKQNEIDTLLESNTKRLDSLKNAYKIEKDSLNHWQSQDKSYYYDYLRERKKRIQLQKLANNLMLRQYPIAHLDSIADHYTFKGNNL